ncbi:MAG: MarR family transcriptional regulator [Planctomycetes bacterium]|nr:MarR family transcriptional regulator [Planctomycetota bacterium]
MKTAAPGRSRVPREQRIARIVQSLRRVFKAIHTYSRQALREFGVTGPQLWLLRTLEDTSPLTVGEIADRMYLHISTVSSVLDRLEERDFIARERDSADHRIVRVRLTGRGRALLRNAPEPAQGKLLHGLERLSGDEIARLHRAVEKLVGIMEVSDVEATFFFEESGT